MKMTAFSWVRMALVAVFVTLTLTGTAQSDITKSGTAVAPRPHTRAIITPAAPKVANNSPATFLVVTRPDLLDALQPLLQWKRQQGFGVEVIVAQTHQRDSIRQLLLQRYKQSSPTRPAQQYVLLVGDADRIQAFIGKHTPSGLNNSVTDLYYGEYTGDYLPEALVGRLSVENAEQLAQVADKIIAFERGDWNNAYSQLLLTAGKEIRSPAPQRTNTQVRHIAELAAQQWPELDTICFYNPQSDSLRSQVLQALGADNAWINYTAHCTRAGWELPTIGYQHIDSIGNTIPAVWVNNCCLSNAFDATCFGEQLLRRPQGGGAAVIGATNETLWDEDFYWAVGAQHPGAFDKILGYDADALLYDPQSATLGQMNYAGCSAVTLSGSRYDAFYWETYTLLGDPSMLPYLGPADSLTMTLDDTLRLGCTSLTVHSQPYARISATLDTLLLATATADSNGEATLNFCPALTCDSLTLTATRVRGIASAITLPTAATREARVAPVDIAWQESQLAVRLRNVGGEEATQHTLMLLPDSLNATITLAPQQDTLLRWMPEIFPAEQPRCSGSLMLCDSQQQCYSQMLFDIPLPDQAPRVTELQLLTPADSLATTKFLPGRDYLLAVTLDSRADSLRYGINDESAMLRSDSETVIIPFTAPAEAEHLHLPLTTHSGYSLRHHESWVLPYLAHERFETGSLENYPWMRCEPSPWSIDSTNPHAGRYCVRSGAIGDNQKSTLMLDLDVMADDSLAFFFNVSSEGSDWFYLFVDGKKKYYASGNSGWKRASLPISRGQHRLEFVYEKDASDSEREDCIRIDDLRLPICRWNQHCGIIEADSTLEIAPADSAPLLLYPNPTSGTVTITTSPSSHPRMMALYDPLGRMADKIFLAPGCPSIQYSAEHLRYNIYLLVLYDEHQQPIALKKLIVTAK